MGKLTYFDSALTNETLNPSFSQWVQEVKDDKMTDDRQKKITNVFVNTSKFESTSVSPVFKQDDTSSVSLPLNDSTSTAKHDVKNNVQSSSS